MTTDDITRDPWARGDCEEGPPPGYAERERARLAELSDKKEPTHQ